MPGPQVEPVLRLEQRHEERHAANMVEVCVGEEDVGVDRRLVLELLAEHAQAGAAVENEELLTAADLETGRISTIAGPRLARAGDAAAHTPETDKEIGVFGHNRLPARLVSKS